LRWIESRRWDNQYAAAEIRLQAFVPEADKPREIVRVAGILMRDSAVMEILTPWDAGAAAFPPAPDASAASNPDFRPVCEIRSVRSEDIRSVPFFGYSMYPALRPGDTLIVIKVDGRGGNIKPGDIVCFPEEERYIAHRVINIGKSNIRKNEKNLTVTTKGDNMTDPDTPRILKGDGILKVTMIRREGKGLVKPRFGGVLARLSSANLTYGIIKGSVGRFVRRFMDR